MNLAEGKINILLDGQFGSTGKGLLASYLKFINHIDISISNASANAGHTFYFKDKKYVTKHIPVSGIMSKRNTIYLCSGAIINPEILLKEIKEFDISEERILVHPRCAIITEEDIKNESDDNSSVTKIASTLSGVGSALSRKINRSAQLAGDVPKLQKYICELDLEFLLDQGCTALMEVPQGFDLSISSGFSYPHCTSREITVNSTLSDAQIHPNYLGKVAVCIRTYPIRVGNILRNGIEIGNSGDFYPDSKELTWEDLGITEERTTVTNRKRRLATFSKMQYSKMYKKLKPDYILLNFANYMDKHELNNLIKDLPEVTHLGYGPKVEDVKYLYWI